MSGATLPSPTGGWNSVSALTDMPLTDAIVLENLIPSATDVQSRDGYAVHTTPALTGAQTLVSYNADTPKLLLGANGNIYDVTSGGAGADLTGGLAAFTNNKWHTSGYKDKIIFCNSADVPMEYDGTDVTELALSAEIAGTALGSDLIDNGDFSTDTAWIKGTGWTIATNVASSDGSQTGDADLTQTIEPTEDSVYKVVFTVSGYSAGNVTAVVGETEGTDRAANGTHIEYITAGAGDDFDIRADVDFIGDIDDVAVYKLSSLAVNGDFEASDTDWTKGTGWSIAAGVAASDGTQTGDSDLTQTITPTEHKVYKVVFTVSGYSAGNVTAVVGGTEGTDRASDATFTEYITAGSGTDIDIRADLDFVGNVDDVEVYATELTLTDLAGSMTFKGRVIYWEKPDGSNPQSFWYAGAGAYTGTLTEFPLVEFTKGGYVVQCFTWTRDGGAGPDDYFVVLMSTGEVLVYAGDDPGGETWALVGIYTVGEPVSGQNTVIPIGGDNIILTKDGYLILSAAIQDGRYSENSHYSFKISPAASEAAKEWSNRFGWEGTLYTGGSLFIVNVPISDSESVQHVRNTTTGAWTKFTGINANAFAAHNGGLYFAAKDGYVYRYAGGSDDGGFIPMRGTQAYSFLGDPHNKKQVTTVEVQSNYQYPKFLQSDFWADYVEKDLPAIVDPPEPVASDWDVGDWDVAQWGASEIGAKSQRRNAQGFGYALSHTLRLRSRSQRFIWYASHIYVKPAGVV